MCDIREYLPNDILSKVDRATMAHGLESRAPLLNPAVAELALTLPDRMRVRGRTTKVALRQLCARHFGKTHAYAPKQGFSIPIHSWLREHGRTLMTALLAPDRVNAIGLLDPNAVTTAMNRHLARERAYGWELWGLMVLVAWYEQRVSSPPGMFRLPDANDLVPLSLAADAHLASRR
jgi:asparagine synthase (glutamine-hydrolysing)